MGNVSQEPLQIPATKETVSVHRISSHWNLPGFSPGSQRILGNAENFRRLGRLHIFTELGHGPTLLSLDF